MTSSTRDTADKSMFEVRQATTTDIDAIHKFGQTVPEFEVNKQTVSFWPKQILRSAIDSHDVVVLIAESESRLCGFVIANYNMGLRKAHIENIFVEPDKRGFGCAEALLKNLEAALTSKGCEYIATLVPPGAARAIEAYGRNGFTKGEDFVWMDKVLAPAFKRKAE